MSVLAGKWVRQITDLQHNDGGWGCFHSLSKPTKEQPITTEQALRRLRVLGLTKDDEPISRALVYMRECLSGKRQLPDRREKVLNWDAFEAHMLGAWIRFFEPDDPVAMPIAKTWAEIITFSFNSGSFNENIYEAEYRKRIPILNKGERLIVPSQFYMVNLLKGVLDKETESHFIRHIINNPGGIYYVYNSRIADLPTIFASRNTSLYIAALEQIAGYTCAGEQLSFAADWLISNKDDDGGWDLGAAAKDGIYLPLSDSWRKHEYRKHDCTVRVDRLLKVMKKYENVCNVT